MHSYMSVLWMNLLFSLWLEFSSQVQYGVHSLQNYHDLVHHCKAVSLAQRLRNRLFSCQMTVLRKVETGSMIKCSLVLAKDGFSTSSVFSTLETGLSIVSPFLLPTYLQEFMIWLETRCTIDDFAASTPCHSIGVRAECSSVGCPLGTIASPSYRCAEDTSNSLLALICRSYVR